MMCLNGNSCTNKIELAAPLWEACCLRPVRELAEWHSKGVKLEVTQWRRLGRRTSTFALSTIEVSLAERNMEVFMSHAGANPEGRPASPTPQPLYL